VGREGERGRVSACRLIGYPDFRSLESRKCVSVYFIFVIF
jgi:hypothetical protein